MSTLLIPFDVLDTAGIDCRKALSSDISDFEDAVMTETALRANMDYIVTRNERDYIKSPVPDETIKGGSSFPFQQKNRHVLYPTFLRLILGNGFSSARSDNSPQHYNDGQSF